MRGLQQLVKVDDAGERLILDISVQYACGIDIRTLTGELSLRGAFAVGEVVADDDEEEEEVLAEELVNTSDALLLSSFSLCNRLCRSCSFNSARSSATLLPCLCSREIP